VTFEATALAAAAEVAVESVVATAEVPAETVGGSIVRTTAAAVIQPRVVERRGASLSGGLDSTRPSDWGTMSKKQRQRWNRTRRGRRGDSAGSS
jgi:hypothetical protein